MKKFVIAAGFALLAACGTKEAAPADPAASETAAATTAAAPAPSPTAGSYDVTNPDGTKGVTTLMADGTYVDRDASDKVSAKGSWVVKDGKTCFTPEGKTEDCYTEGARAADGSFTATDAKGAVTQVKPHTK